MKPMVLAVVLTFLLPGYLDRGGPCDFHMSQILNVIPNLVLLPESWPHCSYFFIDA